MAINYATKYADTALAAFAAGALTEVFAPKYDWTGAKTVTVFTNDTVALATYTPSAGFGTPTLVGNSKDDLLVTQDKGFSALVDKMYADSVNGSMLVGEFAATQISNIVVPAIDTYRLAAIASACPSGQVTTGAVTSANAYSKFLTANAALTDSEVPTVGRVAFITTGFHNSIKQSDSFMRASEIAAGELRNGQVGRVDGVDLIVVPSTRMPSGYSCIIVQVDAIAAPVKMSDLTVFDSVPGYSGAQIDGRFVYDCFLMDTLNDGVYALKDS